MVLGNGANREVEHAQRARRELGDSGPNAGGGKLMTVTTENDDIGNVFEDIENGVSLGGEACPGVRAVGPKGHDGHGRDDELPGDGVVDLSS